MIENILVFVFSMLLVIKGATMSTNYSAKLAENFHLSKYVVGFIIVAFISIIPELFISVNAAIEGVPDFGLATLFGSNIADLTLVFAILIIYAGRGIRIESKILKNVKIYPFFLLLPIIFGLDGYYSRLEGVALIVAGSIFYYFVFKNGMDGAERVYNPDGKYKNLIFLVLAMILLLIGSHYAVTSATNFAHQISVSPIIVGLLVVSLGTTLPELFYSLKSVKKNDDSLAVGDIFGAVLADATIVVGVLALITPFSFPTQVIYITGSFMLLACLTVLKFMISGRVISKHEGYLLLLFWIFYVLVELIVSDIVF